MENVLFKISFPGRVPCADGRRSGARAASRSSRRACRTSRASPIETQEPGVRIIDKTGPARESGRSRSLLAVHGRGAAAVRPPDGRGLRGRGGARSADRRVAGEDGRHGERGIQPRLPRSRQTRDRQRGAGVVRRRLVHRARGRRLSDRASAPARRRAFRSSLPSSSATSRRLFGAKQHAAIAGGCADQARFEALPVEEFMALWVPQP